MFFLQCCIVGLCCMASNYFFPLYGFTGGNYTVGKPLVGGLIMGLVFGNLDKGLEIGCAIQLGYLAYMVVAGGHSVDQGILSYPVIAIAILNDLDSGTAMALGTTVGAIVASYSTVTARSLNSLPGRLFVKHCQEAAYQKMWFSYYAWPLANLFVVRFLPAFIMVYFGSTYVSDFIAILPETLLYGLSQFGKYMPAVGIGILLKVTVRSNWFLLFFIIGFTLYSCLNLSVIGTSILAAGIGYLYYLISSSNVEKPAEEEEVL